MKFVSIVTITFNRRPFIPFLIKCIENQIYPKDKIEWIIIDDGTDKIEDLVSGLGLEYIQYFKYDERMNISQKRNLSHLKCKGDIIIYFDDDDYYPPSRIQHAVESLNSNPEFLIAGCSQMYIYYRDIQKMYEFGPYGKYHSTAASFAFKRELLDITKYDETDYLAEEKQFLKNYTIPLFQLDPKKTILVFSHIQNSVDKNKLLNTTQNTLCKLSNVKVTDIILDEELIDFYSRNMNNLLKGYREGGLQYKVEILKHIEMKQNQQNEMRIKQNNSRKKYETISGKTDGFHTTTTKRSNSVSNCDSLGMNDLNEKKYSENYVMELRKNYEEIIDKKTIIINGLLNKLKNTNN